MQLLKRYLNSGEKSKVMINFVVITSTCLRTFVVATGLKSIQHLMTRVKMEHQKQKRNHISPFIAITVKR